MKHQSLRGGTVDLITGVVVHSTGRTTLTANQLALLREIVRCHPQPATYTQLRLAVLSWHVDTPEDTIHKAARRLRNALGESAGEATHLRPVDAIGYQWVPLAEGRLDDAWTRDADRRSHVSGAGYRGIEHLIEALVHAPGSSPGLVRLRRELQGWPCAGDPGSGLALHPRRLTVWTGDTPRVRALLACAPESEQLALHLLADPDPWLWQLVDRPPTATASGTGSLAGVQATLLLPDGPVRCLEVLGGPEDGRLLAPLRGTLGRYSAANPSAAHGLYMHSRLTDPNLHRGHLEIEGASVRAAEPLRLNRRGTWSERPAGDSVELQAGDVLALTDDTRLRALPERAHA